MYLIRWKKVLRSTRAKTVMCASFAMTIAAGYAVMGKRPASVTRLAKR